MKFLIVGRTASGKDTLANILKEKYNWSFVLSYTTRPKRSEDEDTHIFISETEYKNLTNKVAETEINNYFYCATKAQVENADAYIIDPNGVKQLFLNMPNEDFIIVYISPDTKDKQEVAYSHRGGDADFQSRYKSEHNQFDNFEKSILSNCSSEIILCYNDYKIKTLERVAREMNDKKNGVENGFDRVVKEKKFTGMRTP